ncbi:MAG: DUF402 domain-containing protein [Caldilineaceae bacterium]
MFNQQIEVRSFKWPRRPTSVTIARLLGEDNFGRWLGVARGDLWWAADRFQSGVFVESFVKLVPNNTFWTACFHPVDPVVDVDIVLPVHWAGDVLEEIDLELDILRFTDGRVHVRDQDKFEQVRTMWAMPMEMVAQATATGEWARTQVEQGSEPFGTVGKQWLSRFLDKQ